ncbi:MAG: arginine--tRNA ligase, partial [Candidatus Kerfeldbacteria bacterium RIFCSPHIGHO2_12_FULL_48_17]
MKDTVQNIVNGVVKAMIDKGVWPKFAVPEIEVSYPTEKEHGHISTNFAMRIAKILKKSPIVIAQEFVDFFQDPKNAAKGDWQRWFEEVKASAVAPGFINFVFQEPYLLLRLKRIISEGKKFGTSHLGANKKILIEFISANPTGPLTLANGRGGFCGDTLANALAFTGHTVTREYYLNDVGNQIATLAESVTRKYLQLHGITVDFPEGLYQGAYIEDLAAKLDLKITRKKLEEPDAIATLAAEIQKPVLDGMVKEITRVIETKMRIHYDEWFRESSLYADTTPVKFAAELVKQGLAYEKDGATWFNTTKYGDDKDRVILKKDGNQTYFMSDVRYLMKRLLDQGYDEKILILGADHHGYVKRQQAIAQAIGRAGKLKIPLMQLVKLVRGGQEVRMSKRKGNFVEIEEVLDEVGTDVARFFFLMYSNDTHMTFDLDLAKEQSEKNPVFYIQYAYARIRSIEREMAKRGIGASDIKADGFTDPAETALLLELLKFPEVVTHVAQTFATHKLPLFALDLARQFHSFYSHCRVIDET